jgi:dTDP-glucose 4,6-dehydratase
MSVGRSIGAPAPFVQTNLVGTYVLLDVAREYYASLDDAARAAFRLLQVSTDEVYSPLGDEGCFSELSPYGPNNPYAASKAGADHMVRAYHRTYGLPTLITNSSNNYGPYQAPDKLIPLTIASALEGRRLPIYGTGGNVRDWLHVEDHCAGLLLVLRGGRVGQRYNIGGLNERTLLDVIDAICGLLDLYAPPAKQAALASRGIATYSALKAFVPERRRQDRRYAIEASKIAYELRWRAQHTFATGLAQTVRWYLDNRGWWEGATEGKASRERVALARAVGV